MIKITIDGKAKYHHYETCVSSCGVCGCKYVQRGQEEANGMKYVSMNPGEAILYCKSCLKNITSRCTYCGKEIRLLRGQYIQCNICNDKLCPGCFKKHLLGHNKSNKTDSSFGKFCKGSELHYGGLKPEPVFHAIKETTSSPDEDQLYLGVELEVDNRNSCIDREDALNKLSQFADGGRLLYFKSDGSLSANGIEIVSQPMTLE
jgi:hypothetical protein